MTRSLIGPRHRIYGALAALMLLAAACVPAAPASPAARPTAPPVKPAEIQPSAQLKQAPANKPTTPAELAKYRGTDRQQILEEGARKEGKLQWYTTYIVDQVARPVQEAFKKKYPFVDVQFFRANSGELVQRMINEYRANRFDVDVVNGINTISLLKQAGLVQPFYSPGQDRYTPDLIDPDGYWTATVQYFNVIGYNTSMVSESEAPKTYDALLDPKWNGNFIWSTSIGSGAPMFVGHILGTKGQANGKDYLHKLGQLGVRNSEASARAVLDQVIGGEFPISLQAFLHHALISANKGAPVAWTEPDPLLGTFDSAGLAKNPPNPYTALLFLDFLFSEEGQRVFRDVDYAPARPDVEAKDNRLKPPSRGAKVTFMNPDRMVAEQDEWQKLFEEIFVR